MTKEDKNPAEEPACEACRDVRGICSDCVPKIDLGMAVVGQPEQDFVKETRRLVAIKGRKYAIDKFYKKIIRQALSIITTQRERIRGLKEFARHVIRQECWSLFDLDGGDIQDLAEKLGLIEPHIATEDDIDEESDFEVGDTIFKFSEVLQAIAPTGKEST